MTLIQRKQKIEVIWSPFPGGQTMFLTCPIFEALLEGNRGGGKTDALLMDFCRDVGVGHGGAWRGLLLRRSFPELTDVINKSKQWFPRMFPGATYNEAKHVWKFPTGETLRFAHAMREADYWSYHGHNYTWIGWEELTTWPDDSLFKKFLSVIRTTTPGVPTRVRATTNPFGVGHNWVKLRYRLPQMSNTPIFDATNEDGEIEPPRIAIKSDVSDNRLLMEIDPNYMMRVKAAARNEAELQAWLRGSWDITSGGMFDDIWRRYIHVVPNVHPSDLPRSWRLDRALDWGVSKPFSVGWWAESDGTSIVVNGIELGTVSGDLILFDEWYGWNGKANEGLRMTPEDCAYGIRERQDEWEMASRIKRGPADSAIFNSNDGTEAPSDIFRGAGVTWTPAIKGPGSRKRGWETLRQRFRNACALDPETLAVVGPAEERTSPAMFVMDRCRQFIRTVPTLPRSDVDPDDVDTEAEDHAGDMARYRLARKKSVTKQQGF